MTETMSLHNADSGPDATPTSFSCPVKRAKKITDSFEKVPGCVCSSTLWPWDRLRSPSRTSWASLLGNGTVLWVRRGHKLLLSRHVPLRAGVLGCIREAMVVLEREVAFCTGKAYGKC